MTLKLFPGHGGAKTVKFYQNQLVYTESFEMSRWLLVEFDIVHIWDGPET